MIGIKISEGYENQLLQSNEVLKRQIQLRRDKNEQELNSIYWFLQNRCTTIKILIFLFYRE
jgi:hypothetical protein